MDNLAGLGSLSRGRSSRRFFHVKMRAEQSDRVRMVNMDADVQCEPFDLHKAGLSLANTFSCCHDRARAGRRA